MAQRLMGCRACHHTFARGSLDASDSPLGYRCVFGLWHPIRKNFEALRVNDVPNFSGGIPTGSEFFGGVLLRKGHFQVDAHG